MNKIKISRPEWFTKEVYLDYKKKGITDRFIYEEILFVSLKTFTRFKRELGVLGVKRKNPHNKKMNEKTAKYMRDRGYTYSAIATRFGSTPATAYKAVMRHSTE